MLRVPEAMDVDRCIYKAMGTMNPRIVYKINPCIVVFRAFKGGLRSHENMLVNHLEVGQFNTFCLLLAFVMIYLN